MITKLLLIILFFFALPGFLMAQQSTSGKAGTDLTNSAENRSLGRPAITLTPPQNVKLSGNLGQDFQQGVHRIALAPYTTNWLLSDVSFQVDRIFTNYSGDVSGRFLELAALVSKPGQLWPSTFPGVLKSIVKYQKPDGHFGTQVDWSKPLIRGDSAITLLWGNARLLVGLITAANKLHDTTLLAAAKRLGDFYVNTAEQLCSPSRLKEYKASGTGGDSYTCCYFPAIESLAMLYEATKDERYLHQAQRMAKFFLHFDTLPVNHSHGNLSAWRGILDLYQITNDKAYLQQAINKWNEAMDGGYVWPLGGIGEHWYINYNGDEGCSEADWLRFNLILWRYTGETKYLDLAERLLRNQYAANQTPDGGYGMRHYGGASTGPIATFGGVNEWNFCCNFAGPLGLYFLQSYLAVSAKNNIYINFPFSFTSKINAGKTNWNIIVKADSAFDNNHEKKMIIEFIPDGNRATEPVNLLLRIPSCADDVKINDVSIDPDKIKNGYLVLKQSCRNKNKFVVTLRAKLAIEGRKFTDIHLNPDKVYRFKDVSLLIGPKVLFQIPANNTSRSNLLAIVDNNGHLNLLHNKDGSFASIALPDLNISKQQLSSTLQSAQKISLVSWPVPTTRRAAFDYNLIVIPEDWISEEDRSRFATRVVMKDVPHYGSHLEKEKALWPAYLPWDFTSKGIFITGGGVGLIEGKDYKDYKFEFDMTLPKEGQGISGWVVRAKDNYNYMMFQIQSSDTKYHAPQFKTKSNTLRPILCKNGKLIVLDPVPLNEKILTEKTYHITTVCHGDHITVFINGEKVYEQSDEGLREGNVGFRVSAPLDQGLFGNISLQKL